MITLVKMLEGHTALVQDLLDGKCRFKAIDSKAASESYDFRGKALFSCSKHGDFVQELMRSRITGQDIMPECLDCVYEEDQARIKDEIRRSRAIASKQALERNADRMALGTRFEKCGLDSFETFGDHGRIKALDDASRLIQRQTRWLVLLGSNGTGKTTLASAVGNSFLRLGLKALYYKEASLMRDVRSSFDRCEGAFFKDLSSCDLLCIDEIGRSSQTEFGLATMQDILDQRYMDDRCTILISNLMPDQFWARLGSSIRSRIPDGSIDILAGPDLRKNRKE